MPCERCSATSDVRTFRTRDGKPHHMCLACIEAGLRDKQPEIAAEVMRFFEVFTPPGR